MDLLHLPTDSATSTCNYSFNCLCVFVFNGGGVPTFSLNIYYASSPAGNTSPYHLQLMFICHLWPIPIPVTNFIVCVVVSLFNNFIYLVLFYLSLICTLCLP